MSETAGPQPQGIELIRGSELIHKPPQPLLDNDGKRIGERRILSVTHLRSGTSLVDSALARTRLSNHQLAEFRRNIKAYQQAFTSPNDRIGVATRVKQMTHLDDPIGYKEGGLEVQDVHMVETFVVQNTSEDGPMVDVVFDIAEKKYPTDQIFMEAVHPDQRIEWRTLTRDVVSKNAALYTLVDSKGSKIQVMEFVSLERVFAKKETYLVANALMRQGIVPVDCQGEILDLSQQIA